MRRFLTILLLCAATPIALGEPSHFVIQSNTTATATAVAVPQNNESSEWSDGTIAIAVLGITMVVGFVGFAAYRVCKRTPAIDMQVSEDGEASGSRHPEGSEGSYSS